MWRATWGLVCWGLGLSWVHGRGRRTWPYGDGGRLPDGPGRGLQDVRGSVNVGRGASGVTRTLLRTLLSHRPLSRSIPSA